MPSIVLLQRDHEASPRLQALIDSTERFWVAGTVHTVEEARPLIQHTSPHILVTDLRVQDGSVHELLVELRGASRGPSPQVVVTLVSHDDKLLLEALSAGADGYWIHATAHEELLAALEQVSRGESPMSPTIARQVLRHFGTPDAQPSTEPANGALGNSLNALVLTPPEQEILQWVAQGYLVDEIAQQSQSDPHEVACEIRRVYHKLQFDLRASGLSLSSA